MGDSVQVGYALLGSKNKPAWMEGLLNEKFFVGCGTHDTARKNEKNIYCLDCCKSICPHCLPAHLTHRLLQVPEFEGLRTDTGDFEEGQMTPNSILDNPLSSGSSASGTVGCKTLASTATTDFVKMKRNGKAGQTSTPIAEAFVSCSRRKSTPQRSPLY